MERLSFTYGKGNTRSGKWRYIRDGSSELYDHQSVLTSGITYQLEGFEEFQNLKK